MCFRTLSLESTRAVERDVRAIIEEHVEQIDRKMINFLNRSEKNVMIWCVSTCISEIFFRKQKDCNEECECSCNYLIEEDCNVEELELELVQLSKKYVEQVDERWSMKLYEFLNRVVLMLQLILQYDESDADSVIDWLDNIVVECHAVLVVSLRPLMISWTYTDTRLLLNRSVYKRENLSSSSSFASQKSFFFVVCVKILLVTSRLCRRMPDQQSFSSFVWSAELFVVCLSRRAFDLRSYFWTLAYHDER